MISRLLPGQPIGVQTSVAKHSSQGQLILGSRNSTGTKQHGFSDVACDDLRLAWSRLWVGVTLTASAELQKLLIAVTTNRFLVRSQKIGRHHHSER